MTHFVTFAPSPGFATGPETSPRPMWRPGSVLPDGIETLIADRKFKGEFSFSLFDLTTRTVIEDRNPTFPMTPASVTKTITALYALDTLGPDHRFETRVLATGPINNGVLQGDLILVGSGDPTLDSDRLYDLVQRVKQTGLRKIEGMFYYVTDNFPQVYQIDQGQPVFVGYNPAIGALNLNFNRFYFEWVRTGAGYNTTLDARGARVKPKVTLAQVEISEGTGPIFGYTHGTDIERWKVLRTALGQKGGRWLPVRNPNRYTAEVFREIAQGAGIALAPPTAAQTVRTGTTLATDQSPALGDIIKDMLFYSTNLTAEVIGLAASRRAGHDPATLNASAQHMTTWARTRLGMAQTTFYDHSGLSDKTRMTAQDMIAALTSVNDIDPGFEMRLKSIRPRTATGNLDTASTAKIMAKTGTLNFVSALAGYLTAQDGRKYAFALFSRDMTARQNADNENSEQPKGSMAWLTRSRNVQSGLMYRWARLDGATN